jgi:hypothetical protein
LECQEQFLVPFGKSAGIAEHIVDVIQDMRKPLPFKGDADILGGFCVIQYGFDGMRFEHGIGVKRSVEKICEIFHINRKHIRIFRKFRIHISEHCIGGNDSGQKGILVLMARENAKRAYFPEIMYDMIAVKRKSPPNEDGKQGEDYLVVAIIGKCKAGAYGKKWKKGYQITHLLG